VEGLQQELASTGTLFDIFMMHLLAITACWCEVQEFICAFTCARRIV